MSYDKIYKMQFSRLYVSLRDKAVRKDRTEVDVDTIITWLTGYSKEELDKLKIGETTYAEFFEQAPFLNPNRKLITGKICGISVEDITIPLDQEIRYLDKLIDELAKGKSMEKILRK